MPRKEIDLPGPIVSLSILEEDGTVDEDLLPDLEDERILKMHRAMLLSRRFDERMLRLQRDGRLGTFAPVRGQEAAQVGAVSALGKDDWMVPAFREIAASVYRGAALESMLLFNAGYNEGGAIPEKSRDLPISIPVASQLPIAAGLAYAARFRKTDRVVMTFFGDGATSEGDFHEALNFAGVFTLPVVFVCQNNHWAISHPVEKQSASRTLAQKALAYDMPGIRVDGNDLFAVHSAATDAVGRARSGDGPTLIECVTYRMEVHTTADDPKRYRKEEEVEKWKKRDPIDRLQKYLISGKVLSEKRIEELESEIEDQIDEAWAKTQKKMKDLDDPLVMFDHLYAERPTGLEKQREALARRLEDAANG